MFQREPEGGLLDLLRSEGVGAIAFSPLAQGLLTDRYVAGVQKDSRAAREVFLKKQDVQERQRAVLALSEVAAARGQTLAQMALAWVLRNNAVTSAVIGASRVQQIEDNVAALQNLQFSTEELRRIDGIVESAAAQA